MLVLLNGSLLMLGFTLATLLSVAQSFNHWPTTALQGRSLQGNFVIQRVPSLFWSIFDCRLHLPWNCVNLIVPMRSPFLNITWPCKNTHNPQINCILDAHWHLLRQGYRLQKIVPTACLWLVLLRVMIGFSAVALTLGTGTKWSVYLPVYHGSGLI